MHFFAKIANAHVTLITNCNFIGKRIKKGKKRVLISSKNEKKLNIVFFDITVARIHLEAVPK